MTGKSAKFKKNSPKKLFELKKWREKVINLKKKCGKARKSTKKSGEAIKVKVVLVKKFKIEKSAEIE